MTQQHPPASQVPWPVQPHRGTLVLTLGILSLVGYVGCFGPMLGLVAWVMGSGDLRRMRAGLMDRSGREMTNAGRICGMISVIIAAVMAGLALLALLVAWLILLFGLTVVRH